ncbi:MAG: hypothetical protein WA120_02800 [Candidatus Hydromicrobium sp.]
MAVKFWGVGVGELKNNIPIVKIEQEITPKIKKTTIILAVCFGIFDFI